MNVRPTDLLALLILALAACYNPDYSRSRLMCSTSGECPTGYVCIGGCCGGACPPCMDTLSGAGASEFVIRFKITTKSTVASAVLSQRTSCDVGDYWTIQMTPEGFLKVKLNDASGAYTSFTTTISVNDGVTHEVVIHRNGSLISVAVDGKASGSSSAAQRFGQLPLLRPSDPCLQDVLDGDVSDVCLMRQ